MCIVTLTSPYPEMLRLIYYVQVYVRNNVQEQWMVLSQSNKQSFQMLQLNSKPNAMVFQRGSKMNVKKECLARMYKV